MPGLMEDKLGCMTLYALKLIQFVVKDTNKKRITAVEPRVNESISGQERADFSSSAQLTEQVFHRTSMCIHGECFIQAETKVSNRQREWYITTNDGHRGKVRDDLT